MKEVFLITILAVLAGNLFGQGSVNFANNFMTKVTDSAGVALPVGTRFSAELMYAPDGTPSAAFDAVATRVGATASIFPVAGQFSGGGRTVTTLTPAGGFGLFEVRVWDTTYGATYEEASSRSCMFGRSSILRVDTGDPTTTPPGSPASLVAAGLTGFAVGVGPPCPEPTTYALGALAAAAFCCRRWNRRDRNQR